MVMVLVMVIVSFPAFPHLAVISGLAVLGF